MGTLFEISIEEDVFGEEADGILSDLEEVVAKRGWSLDNAEFSQY